MAALAVFAFAAVAVLAGLAVLALAAVLVAGLALMIVLVNVLVALVIVLARLAPVTVFARLAPVTVFAVPVLMLDSLFVAAGHWQVVAQQLQIWLTCKVQTFKLDSCQQLFSQSNSCLRDID